jgi:hypothetical protein
VHSAINELPSRHQTAITYSLNGMTPEEVGKRMGIGRNAADALLHRARRGLKERLTAVGEGVWGVALGVRVRWDRLTRRVGLDSGLNDTSAGGMANSAITAATAALMAVLTVAGGGSGHGSGLGSAAALMSTSKRSVPASIGGAASTSPSGGAGALPPSGGGTSGGIGGTPYHIGPASGTVGHDGADNHLTLNQPGTGPASPPIDLHYWIVRKPMQPGEGPGSVAKLVCGAALLSCGES